MHQDIRRHIIQTYVNLRIGLSLIAFALPLVLVGASLFDSRYGIQSSLSAYYHTPMRNIFVGALISVGACLYLYKGFTQRENLLLNIAGIFVTLIALYPVRVPDVIDQTSSGWLPREPFVSPVFHGIFAIMFFGIIAYVCIYCGLATVKLIRNKKRQNRYRRLYQGFGILMIVLPLGAALFTFFTISDYAVIAAETSALWVFAAYWLTKSREVSRQASVLELDLIIDPVHGGVVNSAKS